jgi:hypothetical protein
MEGKPRTKQASKIRRKGRSRECREELKCMYGLRERHCPNGPFYSCDQTQTDEIEKLSLIGTPTKLNSSPYPAGPTHSLCPSQQQQQQNCEKTRRLRRHRNRSSPIPLLRPLLVGHLNSSVHVALTHLTWVPATWALRLLPTVH